MRHIHIIVFVLVVVSGFGCSSNNPKNVTKSPDLNPNGDTELALLMRSMYDDGMIMKAAIQNGEIPESHIDISRLRVAEATEPAKVASPQYQAYAQVYESMLQHLETAEGDAKIETYKSLVNTCIACHQAMCPGPVERIRKMELAKP